MYNPFIQLNHQKSDILEGLRGEIDLWLSRPNHTQKLLATLAGISPQVLNDVIQHRRGCGPDMYEKIVKALRSHGNRIVGAQVFGQPVEGLTLDNPTMEIFETEHIATNFDKQREAIRNHNKGTAYDLNRE